jgi:DNA processing protein
VSDEQLACAECLRHSWLLARLAGHLDQHRDRIGELLALEASELVAALGGARRAEIEAEARPFDARAARQRVAAAGLSCVCRCRSAYPQPLRDLEAPPRLIHSTVPLSRLRQLLAEPMVAVVGSRQPSPYGVETAATLARGLAAAGVTVTSGLARGIDTAAHRGSLEGGGPTIAVLAGAAELPYPARSRSLHRQISQRGAVISELPPGTRSRRWMFPARNRVIAAMSAMTVVVEARIGSGALLTAAWAHSLGRPVGAVPGKISSPLARGPHELLGAGAKLVGGPHDILDHLAGLGLPIPTPAPSPASDSYPTHLGTAARTVLDALAEGHAADTALARAGVGADEGLGLLSSLELAGVIRRGPSGGYRLRR